MAENGTELRIKGGKVYDPANGIDGEVRDILVRDGRIVDKVSEKARTFNIPGMVVMPGGIDIHCHIAGPKVNLSRKLQPEDHRLDVHPGTDVTRSGVGGVTPSTFATGYRYAMLGYTTAFDAAVPPLAARHVIEEFHDTPVIDKGFYVLLGNNMFLYDLLKQGRKQDFKDAIAWWVTAARAASVKLVNAGGDEFWKGRRNENVTDVNEKIDPFDLTPLHATAAFIEAVDELNMPHPAHIHCNNLGHSGNIQTTLDTMKAAEGHRAHIAHVQFHSYAGELGKRVQTGSEAIIDYINTHENITTDIGMVMFGKATAMTADAPLTWMLRNKDTKWINADTECESGCGVMPFSYQDTNYTHTMQWAIGLELFLLSQDPWRVMFSTDHPNGASFRTYPRLIRLLMDRGFRAEMMKQVNQKAISNSLLPQLDREYSLYEIAIITRAAPARALGLANKGHLGVGADADITIYTDDENRERMFNAPRYVIKAGKPIIEDHEFVDDHIGRFLHAEPVYDPAIEDHIRPFFDDYYSIQFNNYRVDASYLHDHEVMPLRNSGNGRKKKGK
ncbi:MAG: formylmethanofuran dehydrogenase subunit A [Gammaproteobacteria bacterium]|nr:formylmethanofuran dehydrogenase subunit A [Gammaproteobacteria bacterium]MDE0611937.1 formylmethanofuran dehydrogenase subunit A [Gammaproteobacteria bacterium]